MGMINEAIAEKTARDYENILLGAIKKYDSGIGIQFIDYEVTSLVRFCKKHIYPKYQQELEEAFRLEVIPNEKIIKNFL